MNKKITILSIVILSGCATPQTPADLMPITTEQRDFVYDFSVPGKSKKELFKNARNYLAVAYRNSKEISRVEDEEQGTIIGKAVSQWEYRYNGGLIAFNQPCYSNYNIFFIAKEGKARLQLSIVEGIAAPTLCAVNLPYKQGYKQIVDQFNLSASELENALNGNSTINKLSNF